MEDQIKSSLITLGKISSFTANTRIDTLSGDCDEFVETPTTVFYRALPFIGDSRDKAQRMLIKKYNEVKEHTKYIMQSNDAGLQSYLPKIRRNLEESKKGLHAYKSNALYTTDKKINATVNHLLNDEIPGQLAIIERFLDEHPQDSQN